MGMRPEQFDRAAAKAAGYTDAEIDAFLASQTGPRRSLVPAPAPSRPDPAPAPRAPFLSRVGEAAKGLGRAVINDPLGTAKSIGTGIARTGADLALLARPGGSGLLDMFVQEGADPRKTAVRAANAASLLLPVAGRAAGLGARVLAGADIAASAGLGAAQTPDDPGVGAVLGAGASLLANNAPLRRGDAVRRNVADLDGVTRGMAEEMAPRNLPAITPPPPPTRPVTETTAGTIARRLDDLAKTLPVDKSPGTQPLAPSGPIRRVPVSETVGVGLDPDRTAIEMADGARAARALREGPEMLPPTLTGYTPDGAYIAGAGPVAPSRQVPPSMRPQPAPVGDVLRQILPVGPQVALDNRSATRLAPSELIGAVRARTGSDIVPPRVDVAPAAPGAFPDGFTTRPSDDALMLLKAAQDAEDALLPKVANARDAAQRAQALVDAAPLLRSGANAGQKPTRLVARATAKQQALDALEADLAAAQQRTASQRAALAEATTRDIGPAPAPDALRPVASATPTTAAVPDAAPRTPVVSAIPDAPEANVVRSAAPTLPPAVTGAAEAVTPPVTAAGGENLVSRNASAAADATISPPSPLQNVRSAADDGAEAAGRASQRQVPPKDGSYLNWRTITDVNAPLGKPTLDRIQDIAQRIEPELTAARGKTTMAAQYDAALKTKVIRELFDDPLQVDPQKLKNLSGAQISAVKEVVGENARMAEVISREVASGNLSGPDLELAMRRIDELDNATREALLVVQSESSQRGRDLGYLANVAKLSTDPDVWLVRAQKALGDKPMSDEIIAEVRRLAREATEACRGGA
jgi:hypothetical protein